MNTATLRTLLFGKRLRSDAEAEEQIGPIQGIPILGLDALASASYGPEAALTMLIVAGRAASYALTPVIACIIGLLVILYLLYRQTIAAYPDGAATHERERLLGQRHAQAYGLRSASFHAR